jgi:hypothetical protein
LCGGGGGYGGHGGQSVFVGGVGGVPFRRGNHVHYPFGSPHAGDCGSFPVPDNYSFYTSSPYFKRRKESFIF